MTGPDSRRLLLIALLALAVSVPAAAMAQDEDEDDLFGDLDEDKDKDKDKDKKEGDKPADPNITRDEEEGDDVDDWSFEGEKKVEVKPVVEDKPVKRELEPEPKRSGVSGNWYDVPVNCQECSTLLNQSFGIEEPDVMREFFDFIQIAPDRRSGKFVYPSIGQNRPFTVSDKKTRVLIWQYVVENGTRLTDTYAVMWDLELKAESGLLYGRKYEVQAWTDDAYEEWEKGYKAKTSYIASSKLGSYLDLAPVARLTLEKRNFQVGDSSRVTFVGYSAFVRSDISQDAIAAEQESLKAHAEADAKRLKDQKNWFRKGEDHLDNREWEDALGAFNKARELGLDNLDLNYNLGFSFQMVKDFPNAIKEYETILEADPRDTDVRYNLARIYEKQKNFDAAIKEYQTILKFKPDDESSRDRLELLHAAREMIGG